MVNTIRDKLFTKNAEIYFVWTENILNTKLLERQRNNKHVT